jgi:hypothetical protein
MRARKPCLFFRLRLCGRYVGIPILQLPGAEIDSQRLEIYAIRGHTVNLPLSRVCCWRRARARLYTSGLSGGIAEAGGGGQWQHREP